MRRFRFAAISEIQISSLNFQANLPEDIELTLDDTQLKMMVSLGLSQFATGPLDQITVGDGPAEALVHGAGHVGRGAGASEDEGYGSF